LGAGALDPNAPANGHIHCNPGQVVGDVGARVRSGMVAPARVFQQNR